MATIEGNMVTGSYSLGASQEQHPCFLLMLFEAVREFNSPKK